MDVAGQDRGELGGDVSVLDDILVVSEHVITRPHSGALEAVMHAKEIDNCSFLVPARCGEE